MYLNRLRLLQFKNYAASELHFAPQLNALVGKNGMGKTNLLDAIYYCCMGKSYFGLRDTHLVQHDTSFFRLEADFKLVTESKLQRLVIKVEPRKRKELELNRVRYEKLADHVGVFPVVIIAPDDTQIIREGSEERRRFLDNTLSQLDPDYLKALITYNSILKQRNALLKQYEGRPAPASLLGIYDEQLIQPTAYIFQKRQHFVEAFHSAFQEAYQAISGGQERVSLTYRSALESASLLELLEASREKDRVLQRTTSGIHRDDLVFRLGDHPLKRLGSQGQLKSFVLALKLAQYRFLSTEKRVHPILLLDDVFDKLDPQRTQQLISYVMTEAFGQVFLSDTDEERVKSILLASAADAKLFTIEEGAVTPFYLSEEE